MIIAIDGPAVAGKGTLAKRLARHFKMKFLDTGALYRAVGLQVLMQGESPSNEAIATHAAENLDFDFRHIGDNIFHAFIGGVDIEDKLRTNEVGAAASQVSAFPGVRAALKDFQQTFAKNASLDKGAILDGRDIGTIICPNADAKFFLEADAKIRAERRFKESQENGLNEDFDAIYKQILERDERDRNRKDAPLIAADDAVVIDTTSMNADAVFSHACDIISQKHSQKAG